MSATSFVGDFGSMAGNLLTWVSKECRGWVKKGEQHREITHTLFTGGRLSIDPSHAEEFLNVYARDIDNNVNHFVNELRTAVFRFFVDVDFVASQELQGVELRTLCQIVQRCAKKFYPRVDPQSPLFTCVVCTAPPLPKLGGFKSGVHLHFPELRVEMQEAMLMRNMIIYELSQSNEVPCPTLSNAAASNFAPSERIEAWNTAIDEAVYVSSGLRLLGSLKLEDCPHCKRAGCDECITGVVLQRRPYRVEAVISPSGSHDDDLTALFTKDTLKAVHYTSIRTMKPKTAGFTRMTGCPSYCEIRPAKKRERGQFEPGGEFEQDRKGSTKMRRAISVTDREIYDVTQFIIQKRFRVVQYQMLCVESISFAMVRGVVPTYWVKVHKKSLGANYCLNKMGDHSQNTIYFEFTEQGAVQRCFCTKPVQTNRQCGPCSKWRSEPPVRYSSADWRTLFGKYRRATP